MNILFALGYIGSEIIQANAEKNSMIHIENIEPFYQSTFLLVMNESQYYVNTNYPSYFNQCKNNSIIHPSTYTFKVDSVDSSFKIGNKGKYYICIAYCQNYMSTDFDISIINTWGYLTKIELSTLLLFWFEVICYAVILVIFTQSMIKLSQYQKFFHQYILTMLVIQLAISFINALLALAANEYEDHDGIITSARTFSIFKFLNFITLLQLISSGYSLLIPKLRLSDIFEIFFSTSFYITIDSIWKLIHQNKIHTLSIIVLLFFFLLASVYIVFINLKIVIIPLSKLEHYDSILYSTGTNPRSTPSFLYSLCLRANFTFLFIFVVTNFTLAACYLSGIFDFFDKNFILDGFQLCYFILIVICFMIRESTVLVFSPPEDVTFIDPNVETLHDWKPGMIEPPIDTYRQNRSFGPSGCVTMFHIQVLDGQNLPKFNMSKSANPYVKMKYNGLQTKFTCVKTDTCFPSWNESFSFEVNHLDTDFVDISAYEYQYEKDDILIGTSRITTNELRPGVISFRHMRLGNSVDSPIISVRIQIAQDYQVPWVDQPFVPKILYVTIIGANLIELCDSFCEIQLNKSVETTETCISTTTPNWNKKFEFRITNAGKEVVQIDVMQTQPNGMTSAIGFLSMPLKYIGEHIVYDEWRKLTPVRYGHNGGMLHIQYSIGVEDHSDSDHDDL